MIVIHVLACPAAAPRPTAAVVELREPHCALRPATEIGSGRARLTPSLGPLGLPPRAGSLAWLRRFLGATAKQLVAGLQANSLLIAQRWAGRPSHMASWLLCWWTGKPACQALGCTLRSSNSKAPAVRQSPPASANHAHACARRGIPDPQSKQNTKPTPPKSQRSARSDGRFRGDSQSPGIGPRDARHHDGTHARPVRPSFGTEGMAPEVAASRAPSASTISIPAALDEQADLGAASVGFRAAELSAALRCTGCFFLCARAGGVAWRVACGVFRAPKPPWA